MGIFTKNNLPSPSNLIIVLLFTFSILLLNAIFFRHPLIICYNNCNKPSKILKIIRGTHLNHNKSLKVGFINFDYSDQSSLHLGEIAESIIIDFESVSPNITWKNLFPETINETDLHGNCPQIPFPEVGKYVGLHMVVAKLPCGKCGSYLKKGIRDVRRLQLSLSTAHLLVENYGVNEDKDVYAVFVSKCEPMIGIFRCDDLIWHRGDYWLYKPNVEKLKEIISMPVGSCALARPYNGDHIGNEQVQSKSKEAYVTVLHSSEHYVCGAIALAQSILQTNTTKDLILLADHTISNHSILGLQAAGWKIKRIDRIKSPNANTGAYNEWNYSKLRVWQLTEYNKVMFIDSDFIVLRNIDHFFKYPQLSAAPNSRWIFNSGIILLEPSKCFFDNLVRKRYSLVSYNGGDQGDQANTIWWKVYNEMPKMLQSYCGMTESADARLRQTRSRAQQAKLKNGHWDVEIKDPRQYDLIKT
ncbi:unnamed protein product [Amaranthus hypochondriacus]